MARKGTRKATREYTERVVWETPTFRVTTSAPGEYNLFVNGAWHGVYRTSDQAIAAAHRWLQEEIERN